MPKRDCCVAGDITVTVVHGGFLVGRVLPNRGPGPWWEYVRTHKSLREAVKDAVALAKAKKMAAWFQVGHDDYEPIPLDGRPFVPTGD
jgi:hypothetical protein